MRAVDVDAHIGRCDRIVGGGAQRLAEISAREEEIESDRAEDRHDEADRARLVEEDETDLPGFTRQRRPHRQRRGAEQDQAAIGQHERDAEREDDLRVVPLGFGEMTRAPVTREIRYLCSSQPMT